MIFEPTTLDFERSPYTGLTRASWIEAGEYLLKGIFQHIKSFDDPVIMPRKETKVTYPHSADAIWEFKAEYFEGLARSFFIAAPLIHNDPELTVCGYKIRDYYKAQILRACTKGDPVSAGTYEELIELSGNPDGCFQQTVETSALVICLWICRPEIWETYTQKEKDVIAAFLTGYAHGNTVPQNWRLFNMLDMAFLHMEGYPIDEEIMVEHAQSIVNYYAGDGWYRDGHSFDYYSCWAFNVYAPIWNLWYGYEHAPLLAEKFEEYSNKLMESYSDFFDRDGFTNMWGRSNIYRNAATSAFDGNLFLNKSSANPGLARRICSGSLLQFLGREDFLYKGIPTLGFYGQFTPLVQSYSCAESPFWLGKAFLCLHLAADHPFWTATEENGSWELLGSQEVKQTVLDGPALCFTNHQANGSTLLRTGKVVKAPADIHGMWNYSKLTYHTKYPWESTPTCESGSCHTLKPADAVSRIDHAQIPVGSVESQQYVLHDLTSDRYERCNVTFWQGERDGILYRRQFFDYSLEKECHWMHALNLADFPIPYGMIRADKLRLYRRPISLTLGAYGFPDNGTEIIYRECENAKAIILKGHDFTGKEKQLAMTIYCGWDTISFLHSQGTNPDSHRSIVAFAKVERRKRYSCEPGILLSQVITKEDLTDFADEDIFTIASVTYTDPQKCGIYGAFDIELKNGIIKTVNFEGMEGKLEL